MNGTDKKRLITDSLTLVQSSGHGKMREGALNKHLMSVKYGGKPTKLRDMIIKDVGMYRRKLDIGDTKVMSFVEDDEGPFYLSPQDRICHKYD